MITRRGLAESHRFVRALVDLAAAGSSAAASLASSCVTWRT
jgi:hypothetical protein